MKSILIILLTIVSTLVWSDEKATADNGERILLNEDGTWEYLEQERNIFDFRKTCWGMASSEVRKSEDGEPIGEQGYFTASTSIVYDSELASTISTAKVGEPKEKQDSHFVYRTSVLGFRTEVYYEFVNNILVNSGYRFLGDVDTIDYHKIRTALIQKYGSPRFDSENSRNNRREGSILDFGSELMEGELRMWTEWETERTRVILGLSSDAPHQYIRISYLSKELHGLREKEVMDSL